MRTTLWLSLGRLFLWIGLGLAASGQSLPQPTELRGPYDCSGRFSKERLIFLSGNRWVKGPRFDPAALTRWWVSSKTYLFVDGTIGSRGRFRGRDPGLRGKFRVEKNRVFLFPDHSGAMHSGLQSFIYDADVLAVQEFRMDPASGSLIEVGLWPRPPHRPITCTRDGFF
jgi:hypothetical protein